MNQHLYIKFTQDPASSREIAATKWKVKILRALLFFIPRANPDFDDRIQEVAEWQLEIDPKDFLPVREIGLDADRNVILAMPWLRNIGYWTDNQITLNYFREKFDAVDMDKSEFEHNWKNILER